MAYVDPGTGSSYGGGWTTNVPTSAPSTPAPTAAPSAPAPNPAQDLYANQLQLQQQQMAMEYAYRQGELAYKNAMLKFQNKQLAQQAAQHAAEMALKEALAVGWIKGSPTLEWSGLTGYYYLPEGQTGPGGQEGWAPTLAREQWEAALGLEKGALTGYYEGAPTWERESGQAQLGLQYLQYLNELRKGPRNWLTYWNTQQNARGTDLPTWAETLGGVTGIQPQGATQQANLQSAIGGPTDSRPWQVAAQTPAWANWNNPNRVSWQEFNRLSPSEREGLAGIVEDSGGYWDDYLDRIYRQRPRGSSLGATYYQ